jgi:hypothetical protein
MPPLLFEYPYQYVAGVDHDTDFTAEVYNYARKAVAVLMNAHPVFKVNPDDSTYCYANIAAAHAAAEANLPAQAPIVIELAAGKNHVITNLSLSTTRHVFFKAAALTTSYLGAASNEYPVTRITGNFILPVADAAFERLGLTLHGVDLNGSITAGSNRRIAFIHSVMSTTITRTNGSNGIPISLFGCASSASTLKIVDADDPNGKARITVLNSRLVSSLTGAASIPFQIGGECEVVLSGVTWIVSCSATSSALFKLPGGGTSSAIYLQNVVIQVHCSAGDGHLALSTGFGSSDSLHYENAILIMADGTYNMNLSGDVGNHYSSLQVEPASGGTSTVTNPAAGCRLFDMTTYEAKIWDGAAWRTLLTEAGAVIYNCAESVAVGDWVAQDTADSVVLADASTEATPALGVVVFKPTTTTAKVLTAGPTSIFSGLTAKDRLWLSTTAGDHVVNQTWNPLPSGYKIIQRLGTAKNATTIIVSLRAIIEIE